MSPQLECLRCKEEQHRLLVGLVSHRLEVDTSRSAMKSCVRNDRGYLGIALCSEGMCGGGGRRTATIAQDVPGSALSKLKVSDTPHLKKQGHRIFKAIQLPAVSGRCHAISASKLRTECIYPCSIARRFECAQISWRSVGSRRDIVAALPVVRV